MFLCLFALAGCHIWAPVLDLITSSKMVKFDPSFFGLFTRWPFAMACFLPFKMALALRLLQSRCRQNAFFVSLCSLSRKSCFLQNSSLLADSEHKKGPVWIGSELFVSNLVIFVFKMCILCQFLLMGFCKNLEASA